MELSIFFFVLSEPKIFQNRRVSSAAPVQTMDPSGEVAMWRTRLVWPFNSFTRAMVGYFHNCSWLSAKPWDERISFSIGDHCRAQTWEPVSMELINDPEAAFQNLMLRSAVPPPEANKC